MAKFGDLIDLEVPVLISFYSGRDIQSSVSDSVLNAVVAIAGGKTRVVKMDVDENVQIAEALKINTLPSLMLYKNGNMIWRKSGATQASELLSVVEKFL